MDGNKRISPNMICCHLSEVSWKNSNGCNVIFLAIMIIRFVMNYFGIVVIRKNLRLGVRCTSQGYIKFGI